jgi:RecB family endonuclease NucS
MSLGKMQKTVSLTHETWEMVKRKKEKLPSWNFSAWIRAQIRMLDEGVDPVRAELWRNALRVAVLRQENNVEIFNLAAEIRNQATLEDFE